MCQSTHFVVHQKYMLLYWVGMQTIHVILEWIKNVKMFCVCDLQLGLVWNSPCVTPPASRNLPPTTLTLTLVTFDFEIRPWPLCPNANVLYLLPDLRSRIHCAHMTDLMVLSEILFFSKCVLNLRSIGPIIKPAERKWTDKQRHYQKYYVFR